MNIPESLTWVRFRLNHNRKKVKGRDNVLQLNVKPSAMRRVCFEIDGDANRIIIEQGCQLTNLTIHMKGSHNCMDIGQNTFIGGGYFSFEDDDGVLQIGQNTSILGAHMVVSEPGSKIIIGEDCLMSFDIDVRTGDSHSVIDLEGKRRINHAQDVTISEHVWVSAHVQILKGASIGYGCVIGAGAVVTSKIPENSVAVGVPARVVRNRVTWLRQKVTASYVHG